MQGVSVLPPYSRAVSNQVEQPLDEFSKNLAIEVRALLAEVGKLREERRNIQLFVEFIIHTWLSYLRTNLLAKSVLSCVCEASTKLVACSTRIGKVYHFVCVVRAFTAKSILGGPVEAPWPLRKNG